MNSRGSPCLSRSGVSIVLTFYIAVFCGFTLRCVEVNTLGRFELSLDLSTLKMKDVRVFETSGPVSADARRYFSDERILFSTFERAVNRAHKSYVI